MPETPTRATVRTAHLTFLASDRPPGRHEYDCVFIQSGRVLQADGQESNWLIPAEVLEAAAAQFSGLACYVDHPPQYGFGWRQAPRVANLAGVTFDARWDADLQAVAGGIRLYDQEPGSPGAFVGALLYQILEDRASGREVPPVGLSAVFWQQARLDEESGLRITTEIAKTESVDFVYSAGARGYVRAALAAQRANSPELARYWFVGARSDALSASRPIGALSAPTRAINRESGDRALQEAIMPDETTLVVGQEGPQPTNGGRTAAGHDPVSEMLLERFDGFLQRLDQRIALLEAMPAPAVGEEARAGEGARGEQEGRMGEEEGRRAGGEQGRRAGGEQGRRVGGEQGRRVDNDQVQRTSEGASHQEASHQEEVARLSAAVDRISAMLAGQVEGETVQGMGNPPRARGASRIHVGPGSLEQVQLALEALIGGTVPGQGVRPLSGIRELYHLLSGDFEMTGLYQADRVYLANVNSSTMAGLVANALNKVVVNTFMEYPQWWAPAVTVQDFSSLQDVRWITLGGVGELPTVAEGAAYTELTWDDQTETDSFVKKGGYLGLTIEAIDKDDTARMRTAPRALAQAAWLTLGTSISDIFTSNSGAGPTMADTGALFNATAVTTAGGHANLRTTALSLSEWRTVKIAMMKQAEVHSSTRLGALTRPRLLWVPVDLEDTAVQILATEHDPGSANWNANVDATGNDREARLSNARRRVISCPLWTDANNWAAQADPTLYPSIGLGFRYGRTPEIYSVASPTAGLMFTNDTMPVKVRFFYAVGPTDWRGLHKNNVA